MFEVQKVCIIFKVLLYINIYIYIYIYICVRFTACIHAQCRVPNFLEFSQSKEFNRIYCLVPGVINIVLSLECIQFHHWRHWTWSFRLEFLKSEREGVHYNGRPFSDVHGLTSRSWQECPEGYSQPASIPASPLVLPQLN